MTNDDFEALFALSAESADVEFKGPGRRTDKALFAKVARAVIAMANRRDGGTVVVGVDEVAGAEGHPVLVRTGLGQADLGTWTRDAVMDGLAEFVDPSVELEIHYFGTDGARFVVLRIREFADMPVLCKRDSESTQRGAYHVRTRRKPESVPVPGKAGGAVGTRQVPRGGRRTLPLYGCTEIFEPAARLALRLPGDDDFVVQVTLTGLQNRELRLQRPGYAGFSFPRRADVAAFTPPPIRAARAALADTPTGFAQRLAVDIYHRFRWDMTVDDIRQMQEQVLGGP